MKKDAHREFLKKLELALLRAGRTDVFKIADRERKKNKRKIERLGFEVLDPGDEFYVDEWSPRVPRKQKP